MPARPSAADATASASTDITRIRTIATRVALTIAPLTVFAIPIAAQAAGPGVVVVDGDTLIMDGEKARIQGIDTPSKRARPATTRRRG
jgi:endonuclease YncB( thermonuclease family)